MNPMVEAIVAFTVQATINNVVDAIDRNGLEKTVEDLRKHYDNRCPKSSEEVYQGMLIAHKIVADDR